MRTRGPAGKAIHVILDKCAAHKQAKVRAWLARHPQLLSMLVPDCPDAVFGD